MNRATREAQTLCRSLIDDEHYRRRFEERWRDGTLPPALEVLVWHYAFGRPTQAVEMTSRGVGLAELIVGVVPHEDEDAEHDAASPSPRPAPTREARRHPVAHPQDIALTGPTPLPTEPPVVSPDNGRHSRWIADNVPGVQGAGASNTDFDPYS